MNIFKLMRSTKAKFIGLNLFKKILIVAIILALGILGKQLLFKNSSSKVEYQTATVEKGTLITSVTASGTVSSGGSATITSKASGIVQEVYVQNGDTVTEGDSIALIKLDKSSQQQKAQAWSSYLSAKNNLDSAQTNLYTLQADMFGKWDAFKELAENSTYTNSDGTPNYANRALPEFHIPEKEWLAAEAKYKNQQAVITQAQAALNASWLSYQETSDTITAPISGTVSNLSIAPGLAISGGNQNSSSTNSTTTSSSSDSSQSIGTITLEGGKPQVSVNLTEIDVVKVKTGQKVTLTLDAFPDKTFAGKVSIVNTNGSVSSGVTTYPTTITFDTSVETIYPNMAVNATIITDIKNGVVLVPSGAVQTSDGSSTVNVMRNGSPRFAGETGQITSVQVEVGESNDTQTEILSGVSVGDTVVIGQTGSTTTGSTGSTTSPFGNTRGGFGGGAVQIQRR